MEKRRPDPSQLIKQPRAVRNRAPKLSTEEAMLLLQQQGYIVTAPDLSELQAKHDSAPDALGIKSHTDYRKGLKAVTAKNSLRTITLRFPHSVNGIVYGPGPTTFTDMNLMNSLLSKDQLAVEQENRVFESVGRCHLIVSRRDKSGNVAAYPQPVDSRLFDSGSTLLTAESFGEYSSTDVRG